MPITNTDALTRTIDHREIFHDEMLSLVRRIMSGEMSPVMMAAVLVGLRVKKETIGEITAAAQVMREFSTKVEVADKTNLVDIVIQVKNPAQRLLGWRNVVAMRAEHDDWRADAPQVDATAIGHLDVA